MTGQRLDKWLWFARFAKTRSLAAALCAGGAVAIGGIAAGKSHQPVRVGDTVTVRQGRVLRRVTVLALGERRGPAAEARLLYDEAEPPIMAEDAERAAWTPLVADEPTDAA
ncbi:MAG TPA: RNA-binding S4 domain-containing protein [Stellaceae bacterium]|nr:RNA-binding S4 domain-containing protein [Stellaceae bacterium]